MHFLITTYPEPSHIMNSCARDELHCETMVSHSRTREVWEVKAGGP